MSDYDDAVDDITEIAVNHMNEKTDENSKPYFAPSYFAPSYFGGKPRPPAPIPRRSGTRGLIQQTGGKTGGTIRG